MNIIRLLLLLICLFIFQIILSLNIQAIDVPGNDIHMVTIYKDMQVSHYFLQSKISLLDQYLQLLNENFNTDNVLKSSLSKIIEDMKKDKYRSCAFHMYESQRNNVNKHILSSLTFNARFWVPNDETPLNTNHIQGTNDIIVDNEIDLLFAPSDDKSNKYRNIWGSYKYVSTDATLTLSCSIFVSHTVRKQICSNCHKNAKIAKWNVSYSMSNWQQLQDNIEIPLNSDETKSED